MKKKVKLLDLNQKAFEILKKCKKNKRGTITYNTLYTRLGPYFSIKKEDIRLLLKDFENGGKVEFVGYKGVRVKR